MVKVVEVIEVSCRLLQVYLCVGGARTWGRFLDLGVTLFWYGNLWSEGGGWGG